MGGIPDEFKIEFDPVSDFIISATGTGTLDVGLDDIKINPNSKITIDVGLDNVKINPDSEVKLDVGLDNIKINPESKIDIGLGNIGIDPNSRLELDIGLDNIRIKEIPEFRTHLPLNVKFGLKVLGLEVIVFSLCGELQVILEKYLPNWLKRCKDKTCEPCK